MTTVKDVQADIAAISSLVAALQSLIDAFPATGGSLTHALAVQAQALNLSSAINKGTAHVKAVPQPISDADSRSILTSAKTLEPAIISALTSLVAKKPIALSIVGVVAMAKQNLSILHASTTAIEAALIMATPVSFVPEASALKNRVDAAFATAMAAYA